MFERIKRYTWTIPYIFSYIVWAIFYKVCPLFYDMYVMKVDYLVRNSTFIGVLKAVFFTGGCWRNARYFENIVSIYFASYEWISDLIMPFVFILGVYFSQKIVTDKKKWYVTVSGLALLLCVSNGIVNQCYSYFYCLFTFPIFFMPLFIYLINRYINGEMKLEKWYLKLLFLLLIYCNACFGEHISCAFSVMMAWYLIKDRISNKRWDKLLVVGTILSFLQTIYMNMYLIVMKTRPLAEDSSDFLSILERNFGVVVRETWLTNPIIIISFLLILICSVRKNRIFLIADSIISAAYIIWMALIQNAGGIDIGRHITGQDMIIPYMPLDIWWLWGILYVGINLFVLYQLFLISESIAAIFFAGGCSTVPILLTPTTGWRITAFYIFMIIMTTVMLMSRSDEGKGVFSLRVSLAIIASSIGLCTFIPRIVRINESRERVDTVVDEVRELQESGKWDMDKDILHMPRYDERDVIHAGTFWDNTYYMWNFCYANGLDKETIIQDMDE